MKTLLKIITIFFLFATTQILAQAPDTIWTKIYGGDGIDRGTSVQQTSDGGYVLAGYTWSFGAGVSSDVYLIKTNSYGDTLWTKTYGDTFPDRGYCVQQTTDDGYIIAGWTGSYGAGNYDAWLIKTDTLGETLWTKTYGGSGNDQSYFVRQTTDEGYIIAGVTTSYGAGGGNAWLIKTDTIGDTLWTRTFGGDYDDYANSVRQTTDGGYIAVGSYGTSWFLYDDLYLIKLDSAGDSLWAKTYDKNNDLDVGTSIQQTPDGGYIITGCTGFYGSGGINLYLMKTDSLGDTLWTKTYGGSATDHGFDVQQTLDGGYIVVGDNSNGDVWLLKTDSLGDTLWTKSYGGNGGDSGNDIEKTSGGDYIIVGETSSYGAVSTDVLLIKLEPLGGIKEQQTSKKPLNINCTPSIFNETTEISYELFERNEISVTIYNILGEPIMELFQGTQNKGLNLITWNGRDRYNKPLSSGIYLVKVKAGLKEGTAKLVLTR